MAADISLAKNTLERHSKRSIYYNISYLVQGTEYGTDGAIVLLHDIAAGAFTWEKIMRQLAPLKRAVYAFDMLGYGQSDFPWPADTSVWGQADVLFYLLNDLKLTNIVLVGHGLGGGVAQILASRFYRQQTKALVLVNSVCYLQAFAANWPLPDMKKRQELEAPKETSLDDFVQELRETLPVAVEKTKAFQRVIDSYVVPWENELGKEVLYQHIRLSIPYYVNAVASDLKTTGQPTLIIWGEKDILFPVELAKRLHREIPNSQLVVIPNANHLVLFDASDAVAKALVNFIQNL
jgi:pimeloyl-ACP methyl ester carboxylesterase